MRRLVIGLVLCALLFELVRLYSPATLRTRLAYEFETPEGPRSGATVVEVRRTGAMPYLPGGERGVYRRSGDAAAIDLPGLTVFIPGDPAHYFGVAAGLGLVAPSVDLSGVTPGVDKDAPAFFRRLTRAGAGATLDIDRLGERAGDIVLYTLADPRNPRTIRRWTLAAFESAHPGIRLMRIRLAITSDPVGHGLDALLPWLRHPETLPPDRRPNILMNADLNALSDGM